MATEVSPEGGEVPGAVTDGTVRDGSGSSTGQGAEGGATGGASVGAGHKDSGSDGAPGVRDGSGSRSERGAERLADAGSAVGPAAWDDIALDEDFIRDAEAAEPSARARMLAARWRREAPEPQPWRSDEPPAGWFFSKARRHRWRRR
ncbi:SGM_3592 family protein [Streptomyces bottropensis]